VLHHAATYIVKVYKLIIRNEANINNDCEHNKAIISAVNSTTHLMAEIYYSAISSLFFKNDNIEPPKKLCGLLYLHKSSIMSEMIWMYRHF
jgi:hypothetical protein